MREPSRSGEEAGHPAGATGDPPFLATAEPPGPAASRRWRRVALAGLVVAVAGASIVASTSSTPDRAIRATAPDVPLTTTSVPEPVTTLEPTTTSAPTSTTASAPGPAPAPARSPSATTAPRPAWWGLAQAARLDQPGIYVIEPDGERLSRVAVEPELVANTAFSPDGSAIVFGAGDRLEVIGLDGGGRRTLVAGGVAPNPPLWSPDGRTIAFLGRDPDGYRLKVVDVASGVVRVLATELASVRAFAWHPDGKTLLFGTLEPNIHVVGADGTGLRVHHATARQVIQIYWSPTGHRVLYTSNGRLFTYDPLSGAERELGFDSGGSINNPWAPDGTRFAIGRGFRFSLFGADGPEELVARPAIVIDWSPDGGWLLARREQEGAPPPSATSRSLMDLVVMRPDGSEPRVVLADRADDLPWGHDFEWRPQGDLILLSVSSYRPDYPRYDRN